jgi:hypothetical protein
MASSKQTVRSPSPTGSVRSSAPYPGGSGSIGAGIYDNRGKDDLKVEHFYGDRAKLGMFLVQLKAVFTLQRGKYTTHTDRVLYAGLHMKGSAFH